MMMNAADFVSKREKCWAAICLRISRSQSAAEPQNHSHQRRRDEIDQPAIAISTTLKNAPFSDLGKRKRGPGLLKHLHIRIDCLRDHRRTNSTIS